MVEVKEPEPLRSSRVAVSKQLSQIKILKIVIKRRRCYMYTFNVIEQEIAYLDIEKTFHENISIH